MLKSTQFGGENARQLEWILVTDVVHADCATIAISGSSKSSIELSAKGNAAPADLLSSSGGLGVVAQRDIETNVVSENGLTPLYRGLRVRRRFFGLFDKVQTAASTDEVSPKNVFGAAAPDED